jgi:hypothetical protein
MVLEQVAFDIETTGLTAADTVTVVGFALPLGVRVFAATGDHAAGDLEATVADRVPARVQVSTHATEQALLEAVGSFAAERLQSRDVLLVAFNGERWQAGFDLPFLRTRYAQQGLAWPFQDVPYADLLPVVTRRFNTTIPTQPAEAGGEAHSDGDGDADTDVTDGATTDEQADLAGLYEVLCSGPYGELDPFATSAEAATAFETGRLDDLVVHNVADVLRTRALGQLARRYCAKSDFELKSLTPTVQASPTTEGSDE